MKALTTLPIINMRPYLTSSNQRTQVAQEIREVCKEIGFFYIKNHGISIDLQRSIFQNKQKFFDRPKEEKNKIHMSKGGSRWRGYYSIG